MDIRNCCGAQASPTRTNTGPDPSTRVLSSWFFFFSASEMFEMFVLWWNSRLFSTRGRDWKDLMIRQVNRWRKGSVLFWVFFITKPDWAFQLWFAAGFFSWCSSVLFFPNRFTLSRLEVRVSHESVLYYCSMTSRRVLHTFHHALTSNYQCYEGLIWLPGGLIIATLPERLSAAANETTWLKL